MEKEVKVSRGQTLVMGLLVLGLYCGFINADLGHYTDKHVNSSPMEFVKRDFNLNSNKYCYKDGNHSTTCNSNSTDVNATNFDAITLVLKSSIFVPFALFMVLCTLSYAQMTFTRTARMVNNFPTIPKYPLIGSLWVFFGGSEQIIKGISRSCEKYGRTVTFWMAHNPYIAIMEAQSAQKIMSSSKYIEKGRDYKLFKWLMGDGLITSNGKVWREDRKLLSPSFKYQRFDDFLVSFNKHSRILLEIMTKAFVNEKEEHNFHPILSKCTIDFITDAAVGSSIYAQKNPDNKFVEMVHLALESFRIRTVKPWLTLPIIWDLFGMGKVEPKICKFMHNFFGKSIEERKRVRMSKTTEELQSETNLLMDALLDSRSEKEIVDHVVTMFGAGFETTASTMNYTLYLLGLNKEHQAKVHEEIDLLFEDDKDRGVTFADLSELKYLEMCIKEALRIYPPAPMYMRIPDEDIPLENGLIIPRGCDVCFLLYELHRDPRVFEDPERFDPYRFLPERCANRSPYAYMPFSVGPRNCLGQRYAMVQMKTCLAHILRNFEVSSQKKREDLKLLYGMVLEPKGGIPLTFKKRSTS